MKKGMANFSSQTIRQNNRAKRQTVHISMYCFAMHSLEHQEKLHIPSSLLLQ